MRSIAGEAQGTSTKIIVTYTLGKALERGGASIQRVLVTEGADSSSKVRARQHNILYSAAL